MINEKLADPIKCTVYFESADYQLFKSITKKKGVTALSVLRKFMKEYINENEQELKNETINDE